MNEFQFIGIDVSKDKFDIATLEGPSKIFSSSKSGLKKFSFFLDKNFTNPWVCMEATGHYSEILADYLHDKGVRVSVVNPLQIKNFARSCLTRNKNDSLDAKIIADFAKKMQPRTYTPRSETQKELKELVKFLETLKTQLVQLKNQLHSTLSKLVQKELKKAIAELEKKIKALEKKINDFINAEKSLKEKVNLLSTIKGIGNLTAIKLLAFLPDVSLFSHVKQFAAFAGVTPRQFQSGKFKGKSSVCKIGNPYLRKALYMAALVAKRFNSTFKIFVDRMKAEHKPPKVIVCAIMRKLMHVIFGILKNNATFNPILK